MLPSVLSHELREGVEAFLRATYPTSTPAFKAAFDQILEGAGKDRLFQGPYLRVGLPFQSGGGGRDFFPRLQTKYPPYRHQEQAYARLRTEKARSTIIATGTGSGKTECFLYPIVDHVLANPSQRGLKAIVIYPMNALASDQARRFAKEVFENSACTGKVRVGLFVGGEGDNAAQMSENGVITSKEEMRKNPPDILLTNYKMLDYLLIRQADRPLWEFNEPDTLRYLAVDEIHTFDGAQGTDLACLIRRVKARVKAPKDYLCCVGTSATLGGDDSREAMIRFAELIFGEAFMNDAVITESRKSAREHIEDTSDLELRYFSAPGTDHQAALSPANYSTIHEFVVAQSKLWFGRAADISTLEGQVALGRELRGHNFLRTFLRFFENRAVVDEREMLADLALRRGSADDEHDRLLLNSFISLCAVARSRASKSDYFLQLRSELWMREMSRMVATVNPHPVVRYSHDLNPNDPQRHLAPLHCRECGVMGWGGVQKAHEDRIIPDLDKFYSAFFARNPDPRLRFIFPVSREAQLSETLLEQYLCGGCLTLFESKDGTCPSCGTKPALSPDPSTDNCTFKVEARQRTTQRQEVKVADKSCPFCDSSTGLTIVGSRAASLTSVGLSQLFGSPYNDDKKAMAFSDSVQDASHRAGFFTARTYQITVRTAMCQEILAAGEHLTLSTLSESFAGSWIKRMGPAEFVGTFFPPSLEWLAEYDTFKAEPEHAPPVGLVSKVKDRLQWEVIREFGLQCRIGRTLEKSGAAACHLDPVRLDQAAAQFLRGLHDLSPVFKAIDELDARRLVAGLSERLRANGGIYHPFLKSYLEKRGDTWLFNQYNGEALKMIPKPGTGIRPTFFATFAMKDTFERLVSSGSTPTWTERWVQDWMGSILGDVAKSQQFSPLIELLVKSVADAGLWQKHVISEKDGEYAWSLNPEHVHLSSSAVQHACRTCGHQVTTSESVQSLWDGIPCLRHKCQGNYQPSVTDAGSFFSDLYRKGNVVRLRAGEHTGMLDRATRESLEQEFMRSPPLTTDTNLLSCTPTMEMGVDVGDLSTVLLCSVPPEQANYLQRVGRGGRRDGNSLALTIATSDAHDLSFYEAPLNMIAGKVEMPAIFLRAPAVLERQLTAYCLDRWIESTPSAQIPRKMDFIYSQMAQTASQDDSTANQGVFPKAFYHFIELHLTLLIQGFEAMFDRNELDHESIGYLQTFIQGDDNEQGSLCYKINAALAESWRDLQQLIDRRITRRKAREKNEKTKPRDEKLDMELLNLKAEINGLTKLVKEIRDKQTLNFLSDEGLIPNYAFPEEGVTLRSIILKKPGNEKENSKLIKLSFEHVRPAEAAITELAPGNSFYVEGRKLTIDQVAVDQNDYEEWHFCRSCSHLEPVSLASENFLECPKCHCPGWKDHSLKQKMLRMRQVFVTAWDKNVRNLDQKDDRDLTAFNKQTSIDYQKEAVRKSYSLRAEGAIFAFDFLDLITLREVNFGEDREGERAIQIGGKDLQGIGFPVCTSCGKIQTPKTRAEKRHDISCKHYGKDPDKSEFENAFLLYRELNSEAIRLLIPSVNQDEGTDTQSFVAAIHLGLKATFGGHLNHLKLSVQQLPIAGGNLKSQHVFIYDSVPGGTGYLKDLTRTPESFLRVLEKSLQALEACDCGKDPNLDGCYQCLKAYRFRFVSNQISRRTAISQLKRILDNRAAIEERSADDALINPLLESELERRFIESLRQVEGFQASPEVVDGQPGYLLKIGTAAWKVIPQVPLGAAQGVEISSRPDFLLRPLRPSKGMPIAVFLDGFAYHADAKLDNNRIADDIAKRNALRMSGRYLVWSLTWADMKGQKPPGTSMLSTAYANLSAVLNKLAPQVAGLPVFSSANWNSWELLIALLKNLAGSSLENPLSPWKVAASILSCNFVRRARIGVDRLEQDLTVLMNGMTPQLHPNAEGGYMSSYAEQLPLRLLAAVPILSLQGRSLDGACCALWFDDTGNESGAEFKDEWQELLWSSNLLQLVPRFCCFTKGMVAKGLTSHLIDWLVHTESTPVVEQGKLNPRQIEELEMLDETLQPILAPLLHAGTIPWPVFGYEATSPSGVCSISMLEVAWPEFKIGIALPNNVTSDFEASGWTVLSAATIEAVSLPSLFQS